MARLSGLQRSVLSLYRRCLRETRKKPAETRQNFTNYIRNQFRENSQLDKKDFATIEFLLRKATRQLEMYSDPGIKNITR